MKHTTANSTLTDRVAAMFISQANRWIDGRDIAEIGGAYGWRTRVSEMRRPPFNLRIVNRTPVRPSEAA